MSIKEGRKESNNEESMLSTKSRLLTAIAAAASLNCESCLETLIPQALKQGVLPEEISEVFSIVTDIRDKAIIPTRDLAARLLELETHETAEQTCCDSDSG